MSWASPLLPDRSRDVGVWRQGWPFLPTWRAARLPFHQWMLGHGLAGRRALLDLAVTAAREAGLAEPRVHVVKSAVTIALADEGDAMRWIMDALWEGGVGPRSTLLAVDEQHGFDGLGRLMIPEATGVTEALND